MGEKIKVFDLHCDTLSESLKQGCDLYQNELQLDLQRGCSCFEQWIQTFAFWIDDCYRGEAAWNNFLVQYAQLQYFIKKYPSKIKLWNQKEIGPASVCHALMAIEGGAALGGKLERVHKLSELGIAMLTLVWNGENELGSGVRGNQGGLTTFGKEVVKELEQHDILVDVSHLNDAGFWDVEKIAKKTFVATHSNCRSLCNHPRNLTDEQIKYMIERKCLIGINFYPLFVNGEQEYTIHELILHMEHILSLGGEHVLSLGSDFDGADMPRELSEIKGLENLYRNMIKYFGKDMTKDIFFGNAVEFFRRVQRGKGKEKNVL